jgi:hypothetical protein
VGKRGANGSYQPGQGSCCYLKAKVYLGQSCPVWLLEDAWWVCMECICERVSCWCCVSSLQARRLHPSGQCHPAGGPQLTVPQAQGR